MKRRIALCMALCCLSLTVVGCNNVEEPVEESSVVESSEEVVEEPNIVLLYTVPEDASTSDLTNEIPFAVEEEITPELVLDIFALEVLSGFSGSEGVCQGVTVEEGIACVSFTEPGVVFISAGSYREMATLDGIAKTLLKNCPELEGVSYAMDGAEYSSGHFYFELGEVYATQETFVDE